MFFGYIRFFCPIFYIQSYGIEKNLMGENLAFYLVAMLNAASMPDRIILGLLGQFLGLLNLFLISTML
ncbi:hypothetical protein EYZ11_005884 [Aspergillus tanneri]|uniref:Uncharacterized protein n=1 Tax=Aspergillus tanneri TaxID=1220188 RepID=A0A4S3JGU7_9EURO|nr:hypothetical protein EYZ11_005884 [Aspergillus tanneri]